MHGPENGERIVNQPWKVALVILAGQVEVRGAPSTPYLRFEDTRIEGQADRSYHKTVLFPDI
jgi:hypothetical protein